MSNLCYGTRLGKAAHQAIGHQFHVRTVQSGKTIYDRFCRLFNLVKCVTVVDTGRISFISAHVFSAEQHSAAALEEVRKEASGQHSAHNVAAS